MCVLSTVDRVLQPRAAPAEAKHHAPLRLWHLRLSPALCFHCESSCPHPGWLWGGSYLGTVAVTLMPQVPDGHVGSCMSRIPPTAMMCVPMSPAVLPAWFVSSH